MSLISIIIPSYNYGKFLPATLKSILEQTYSNWECIIVDDGSTDNTKEIAQEYIEHDKRIKYVFQKNSGLSAARNTGIRESKGNYLQFIDADDLIESKKLEEQINVFEKNPNYDIIYSSVRYFRNEFPEERLFSMSRINNSWMPNVSGMGYTVIKFLFERNIMAANCPLIRRRVCEDVGLFNQNLKYLEDWDYWFRCALGNKYFFFLDKPDTLALVRVHGKSITNNTWEMRHTELLLKKEWKSKILDVELSNYLEKQIDAVNKTLVGIAVYELVKGNIESFKNKLKLITEEDTLGAAYIKIIRNKYLPNLTMGKLWFYGKKMLINSK